MRELLIAAAAFLLFPQLLPAQSAPADSPVGLWKSIDDKSGAPKAMVRITEHDGQYWGHIERSFKPNAESRVCDVCSDDRHNHPIIGLEVIRGMTRHGDEFSGGEILDPESGWVYRCRLHLEEGGEKLIVRGYIGFSFLGRSQTWTREH